MSPAPSSTTSPWTTSRTGTSWARPSRITVARSVRRAWRAATDASARASWTNPSPALIATIARMIPASTASPTAMLTQLAATRMRTSGLANWLARIRARERRPSPPRAFGPSARRRSAASAEPSPAGASPCGAGGSPGAINVAGALLAGSMAASVAAAEQRDPERTELAAGVDAHDHGVLVEDPARGSLVRCLEDRDPGVDPSQRRPREHEDAVGQEALQPLEVDVPDRLLLGRHRRCEVIAGRVEEVDPRGHRALRSTDPAAVSPTACRASYDDRCSGGAARQRRLSAVRPSAAPAGPA